MSAQPAERQCLTALSDDAGNTWYALACGPRQILPEIVDKARAEAGLKEDAIARVLGNSAVAAGVLFVPPLGRTEATAFAESLARDLRVPEVDFTVIPRELGASPLFTLSVLLEQG